jgi:hypothetical protein
LVQNNWHEDTLYKFKIQPRYLGPYEVLRKTKKGNYVLMEMDGAVHQLPYAAFCIISYIHHDNPNLMDVLDEEGFDDADDLLEYDEQDDQPDLNELDVSNSDVSSNSSDESTGAKEEL